MPKYQGLSQQYLNLDEKIFYLRDSYEVGGSSIMNIIIARVPVLNGAECLALPSDMQINQLTVHMSLHASNGLRRATVKLLYSNVNSSTLRYFYIPVCL